MEYFESERNEYREAAYRPLPRIETSFSNWRRQAIGAYEDRATSRVSDVSSVVLRDLALWAFFLDFAALSGAIRPDFPQGTDLSQLALFMQKTPNEQMDIEEFSERLQWGKAI